jgi:hypothetical protein
MELQGSNGPTFRVRYNEHITDIRGNSERSVYSHHILNTGHSFHNLENTLQILHAQKKGPYLNTSEKLIKKRGYS